MLLVKKREKGIRERKRACKREKYRVKEKEREREREQAERERERDRERKKKENIKARIMTIAIFSMYSTLGIWAIGDMGFE